MVATLWLTNIGSSMWVTKKLFPTVPPVIHNRILSFSSKYGASSFEYGCRTIFVSINPDSLKIINRTKKNLIQGTFKNTCGFLLQKLINDFSSRLRINNNQRQLYINEFQVDYKCDLTEFNQEKIMKIEGKVQEEINNIKTRLYEKNINGYNVNDTKKLVNEYMDNDGIEIVLLVKKMIYFYFKEMEFYEEKDQKVFNILANKGNIQKNILNEMLIKNKL